MVFKGGSYWTALLLLAAGVLFSSACAESGCFAPDATAIPQVKLLQVQGRAGLLRVEDGGEGGVPVIFVHGLGGDRRVWTNQVEHLRLTRRAVALDLRGHGESEPSKEGDYGMEAFASDVLAVADALAIQRFVLVGHSMGGAAVGAVAGKAPDRVAGILFDDAAGDLTQIPANQIEGWLQNFSADRYDEFSEAWFGEMLSVAHPATREQVMEQLKATPREVVAASARSMAKYAPLPALKAYHGPMLAVVTFYNNQPYSLQNIVPGLKSKEVRDASHWIQMDRPTEFNQIMDEFLLTVK
jgi:pimeloyl-ACP methyl ester carboxylesterase